MYQPLAAAVIAAMAASLVLALTLVPVVGRPACCGRAPRRRRRGRVRSCAWLKARYAPLLDACLRHAGRRARW